MIGGELQAPLLAKRSMEGLVSSNKKEISSSRQDTKSNEDIEQKEPKSFSNELKKADSKIQEPKENSPPTKEIKEVVNENPKVKLKDTTVNERPVKNISQLEAKIIEEVSEPKQNPISMFMDSMENELGVEPERLIEAIGTLSEEDLQKDPMETMEQVIVNLQLDPQQTVKAKEIYSEFVQEWKDTSPSDINSEGISFNATNTMMKGIQKEKQSLDRSKSIDDLTKKFFDVYPKEITNGPKPILQEPERELHVLNKNVVNSETANIEIPEEMVSPKKELFVENKQEDFLTKMQLAMNEAKANKDLNEKVVVNSQMESAKPLLENQQNQNQQANQLFANAEVEVSSKDYSDNEFFSGDSSQNQEGNPNENSSPLAQLSKNEFQQLNKQSETDAVDKPTIHSDKISELVDKVSVLAKKGGGEMNVQLNSKEMGNMHLKVAVNEGKVDVQLITEHKDTKKLIEGDLAALKVELGNKNLELNEIKVDVAKDLRGELQQQMSDQRREEAREFLREFRENNNAFKEMNLFAGMNNYNTKKDPDHIERRANAYRRMQHQGNLSVLA